MAIKNFIELSNNEGELYQDSNSRTNHYLIVVALDEVSYISKAHASDYYLMYHKAMGQVKVTKKAYERLTFELGIRNERKDSKLNLMSKKNVPAKEVNG